MGEKCLHRIFFTESQLPEGLLHDRREPDTDRRQTNATQMIFNPFVAGSMDIFPKIENCLFDCEAIRLVHFT